MTYNSRHSSKHWERPAVNLVQELQRRQHALVVAEAEVKRFEKLEEKDRIAFHIAMLRRQQAEADDATSSRYIIERQR